MCYNSIGDSMKDRNVGGVFYKIEVYDKDGKLIEEKSGKGDSILYNWTRIFEVLRNPPDYNNKFKFVRTDGNVVTPDQIVASGCSMLAPSGNDSYGIVVGSGSTAVDLGDFDLASKIPHGTGSGQLSYGDTSKYEEISGTTVSEGVQRSFDNNSGADITINEIGLVVKIYDGSSEHYVLIMRDVISATTVPNGGRVTVKYWITWNP